MRRALSVGTAVALLLAGAASAAAPTHSKGELIVALNLPSPGFQVGAVRGSNVVYARGLEVDLARRLAGALGVRRVRFVQVPASRIATAGPKPWDLALAQVTRTPRRERTVDLSDSYLTTDQVVLLARGAPRPRSLGELAKLQVCAVRGSRGADVVAARVRPLRRTLLASDDAALLRLVQTGRCDAAVRDLAALGIALASVERGAFGKVAARIETGDGLAAALPKHSPLTPDVDRALGRLRADGTLRRLVRTWLGIDPAVLPVLR